LTLACWPSVSTKQNQEEEEEEEEEELRACKIGRLVKGSIELLKQCYMSQ